jgi:hypothetical protein
VVGDWSNLEERLKKISEKAAQQTSKSEEPASLEKSSSEKPKPTKGAFSEYRERVQQAYQKSSAGGGIGGLSTAGNLTPREETKKSDEDLSEPKPMKGAFSEYRERIQQAYKSPSTEETSDIKDKYESMLTKVEKPTLKRDNVEETKQQFKGFEKRFLRSR